MYLQVVPFNLALMRLGCFESEDAARLLGLKTPKTIDRAREGGAISSELMGCAMAAFRLNADRLDGMGFEVKLDSFFVEGTREEREAALAEAVAHV